jgi:hypothetical protein
VAHPCNPSCSGGRHQEDRGSKPAQANSLWDPISKKTQQKKDWWSGLRYRPWIQTPYHTHTHTREKEKETKKKLRLTEVKQLAQCNLVGKIWIYTQYDFKILVINHFCYTLKKE